MNHLKAVVTFEDRETTLNYRQVISLFAAGQMVLLDHKGSLDEMDSEMMELREAMVLLTKAAPPFEDVIKGENLQHLFPEYFSNPAVTTPEHWEKENKNE